jgi:UPF0042 nucleotide-binding protein
MSDPETEPSLVAGVPLVIITGLSGAGKSSAMRFLEDLGCRCLDNLPPALIPEIFDLYERAGSLGRGVVIASDVRSGALFDDLADTVASLNDSGVAFKVLYLDCATDTLIRRFKEVRRNHPLQRDQSMEEAIEQERKRLEAIRVLAGVVLDTSRFGPSDLREALLASLSSAESSDVIRLTFFSFGFKHGIPRDIDFLLDARFLPNPHYVPELEPLTGEDEAVYDYVMGQPLAEDYFERAASMIELTLAPFVKVGKTNLTVGIGCTGGRHRSVALARRLAEHFSGSGRRARAAHRDIARPIP